MKKIGLIINPIAGMGGRVGLKGTDGIDVLHKAIELGAEPQSSDRVEQVLNSIAKLKNSLYFYTAAGNMGGDLITKLGFKGAIIGCKQFITSANDTKDVASQLLNFGIDLLLFAGGDGTARDIQSVIKHKLPVVGIPTGVKMHSAVFTANPQLAANLLSDFISNKIKSFKEAEVMDIDEDDYRNQILSAKFFGYLLIPDNTKYFQNLKSGSPESEKHNQQAIAEDVVENMEDDIYYIIGPGSTPQAVMNKLQLNNSLLGIDVVKKKQLVAEDLSEQELLKIIDEKKAKIIITPIGGQGFIFGRGNQQISPAVIKKVRKDNIIIISTKQKLNALLSKPLITDTHDSATDDYLRDYYKIVTGYHESVVYKIN